MILGAATGILTGGVSLVGGAVVGAVGGTVLGSLFHKNLGLTDADEERLQQHLQDGGAAVVVMADENEVEPTKAELARLGGRVEDYLVPEETMEQVEDVDRQSSPLPQKRCPGHLGPERAAAEPFRVLALRVSLPWPPSGSPPSRRCWNAAQRRRAEPRSPSRRKISEKLIAGWVSAVDLSRVKGIGPQSASCFRRPV